MKIFSGQGRRQSRWGILAPAGLAVGCALMLVGCGHRETTSPPSSTSPAAAPSTLTSTPVPPSTPALLAPPPGNAPAVVSVAIAANPRGGADLKQLNHAYLRWIAQNRRRPKNYEDFIAASGIQVPPAPAGQKYVIDKNGFIALASE